MSRIGRMPVVIPQGVEIKAENGLVTVKGPKGTLSQQVGKDISVKMSVLQAVEAVIDITNTNIEIISSG